MSFKILISDDSILVRKKIKEDIEQYGCIEVEVIEATDGQAAIARYKEHKPNLVFMDIVMPQQDGIDALIEIKKFDPSARVIMLSSAGTQSNIKKAIQAGACDFIQKPWEQSQLNSILDKFFKGGDR